MATGVGNRKIPSQFHVLLSNNKLFSILIIQIVDKFINGLECFSDNLLFCSIYINVILSFNTFYLIKAVFCKIVYISFVLCLKLNDK